MDNLPLLKDIHLPEPIWSFAPLGWFWLMLVIAPIVSYFAYRTFKYVRAKSRKYYALRLLKNAKENNAKSVELISEILRRICLYKYKKAITLFGQDWIDFLNGHSQIKLKNSAAELLVYGMYVPQNKQYDAKDYDFLRKFTKKWIGENL